MREFDLAISDLRSIYKTLPKSPAVYIFLNKINGHRYIGSSINLKSRIRKHLFTFTSSRDVRKSACPILLRAVRKYSLSNFCLQIVVECKDASKEVIRTLEQDYITLLCPEYNAVKEVNKCNSFVGKQVHQYSSDGEYIQSFSSVCEASRCIGVHDSTLRDLLNHRESGTCKGYQFSYKKSCKISPFRNKKFRPVDVCTVEGSYIGRFQSIAAAARSLGLNPSRISEHVANPNSSNVGGYIIIYTKLQYGNL